MNDPVPDPLPAPDWHNPDLTPQRFHELGHRVADMIAAYATIDRRPVFPARPSSEVAALFAEPLPQTGQDPDAILNEWQAKILPNATHLGSPRDFGFVNGSGTMIATLAEALAASVDAVALEQMVAADLAQGDLPFCVVVQFGSINTGAIGGSLREISGCVRRSTSS